MSVPTIAELPFVERPVIELLALDRDEPLPDYAGYGWAKVDRLWLAGERGAPKQVDNALVIAVHAADEGAPQAEDIELELEIDRDLAVRVALSRFLAVWLPRLPQDVAAIVLVTCNPHRARLPLPPAARAPIYGALGDVYAWLDPGDRIRLAADSWRTLGAVTTELQRRPNAAITDEDKQTYAGLYVMKKMDLRPEDGGMTFPVVLPSELSPLDELLQQLAVDGYVQINAKKERWELTKQGIAYLGENIDEATDLVDEFDEAELPEVIAELEERKLDVFRARFLWGWYDGELDDLVLYQERRGIRPVERMWAFFLMGDELWNDLARDLEAD